MQLAKWLILIIFFFSLVLFAPLDSNAFFWNGNKLVENMREYEKTENGDPKANVVNAGRFMGYVAGVWDATEDDYDAQGKITIAQICSIVAKYLTDNPKKWNLPANTLVRDAFRKAFPKRK
jgi:hypothetical protein